MKWVMFQDLSQSEAIASGGSTNVITQVQTVSEPKYLGGVLYGTPEHPYYGYKIYNTSGSYRGTFFFYKQNDNTDRWAAYHISSDNTTASGYQHSKLLGFPDNFTYPPSKGNYSRRYTAMNTVQVSLKRTFKSTVATASYHDWTQPVKFNCGGVEYIGMKFNPYTNNYGTVKERVIFLRDTGTSIVEDVVVDNGVWNSTAFPDSTVDFGDLGQDVCDYFKTWLFANTTLPKTARITIKSFDGKKTLAQSDWITPFSSLTIGRGGNTVTITTDTAEQIRFTLTEPNKEFAGLSGHALSVKPLLRSGRTSELNVDSPITLYECYGAVVPVPTTYGITFYHSSAEPNRCDKTNYLTSVLSLTGTLREGCSVMSPAFNIIADDEYTEGGNTYLSKIMSCNYCYIPKFGRYYFITDISNVAHNVWRVAMSCDVLHTFWGGSHGINTLQGVINRTADGNYVNDYIQDTQIMTEVKTDREYVTISNGNSQFDTENPASYNILLNVFGSD